MSQFDFYESKHHRCWVVIEYGKKFIRYVSKHTFEFEAEDAMRKLQGRKNKNDYVRTPKGLPLDLKENKNLNY